MDRPITFSEQMVRALIAGKKTQTRRAAQPFQRTDRSPFGVTGDRLWVRETWRPDSWGPVCEWMTIQYKAGGPNKDVYPEGIWADRTSRRWARIREECIKQGNRKDSFGNFVMANPLSWRPPLSLPQAASRIKLSIKSVRLESVQSISESDAIAEGCSSICEFRDLWDSINAKRGLEWDLNPPAWVIEFDIEE